MMMIQVIVGLYRAVPHTKPGSLCFTKKKSQNKKKNYPVKQHTKKQTYKQYQYTDGQTQPSTFKQISLHCFICKSIYESE